MVEVFRTNVAETAHAIDVIGVLQCRFPTARITLDLEDCDRVLRVEGHALCQETIVALVGNAGFDCSLL